MQAVNLPQPAPPGGEPTATDFGLALEPSAPAVPASVVTTAGAVAAGLAAIGATTTATAVYHAACTLALRLPGVRGVAVLRRDDHGLVDVAYTPLGAALPASVLAPAGAALHQRWIAAHAPGAPAHGLGPFDVEGQPDLLVVPFVRDDALLGALVIAGKDGRPPAASKAERITAAAIGVAAAQALGAVALRQRLELAISRTEHEEALAAERKRISHALHDGPTQELALAGITLDRLIGRLGPDGAGVDDARQARDLIDRAIHGMRGILARLRTKDPALPSVTGPLRELIAEIEQAPDPDSPELAVDISQVSGVRLTPDVERAVVGIVREALHNVRKHADADSVQLEVRRDAQGVEVAVVDDGVGFDGMGQAGHFGLEQIRELAEGTGGRVEVGSLPGIGTSVRAWIPLPGEAVAEAPAWAEALTLDWGESAATGGLPTGGT